MNLTEMKARLASILASLEQYKNATDLNDQDVEQIESLSAEYEQLEKKIQAAEKMEQIQAKTSVSTRKAAPVQTAQNIEMGIDRRTLDPKGGFQHSGDFFKAVAQAAQGNIDKRLNAGMTEKVGEDGGFLIPPDFRTGIIEKVTGDESLLPRTTRFTSGSNHLVLPVYESAPYDSSAIQAYWEGEAQSFTESKTKFKEANFRLHKLTAMVKASEELLDDASALQSFIQVQAPNAMLAKVNSAIIGGDGVGKPEGLLNSGFKYKVAKESGQAADTVLFANVNNMLARLAPLSASRAVWLCHPAVLPQLRAMEFKAGANSPVPVYMPGNSVAGNPFGSLYGMPVLPMLGGVKNLGDEGDLILVDLAYYYTVMKTAGVKQDISTHVYFSTQETAFRFVMRMAGQCPFKTPIKTENGDYSLSGIVTLEDR